jgi:hypothetical protein
MDPDPKSPMTAGEWAKQTRVERIIGATLLFLVAGCGLLGAISAMLVFSLGELTGHALTDTAVLAFVSLGSLIALHKALYLIEGPVCRFCRQSLKEDQFRCPRCARLVNRPDEPDAWNASGRDDYTP